MKNALTHIKQHKATAVTAALAFCIAVPVTAYATSGSNAAALGDNLTAPGTTNPDQQAEATVQADSSMATKNSPVDKTQVVYVDDDAYGAQQGVYVVNTFKTDRDALVYDTGNYSAVENLTDTQSLEPGNLTFNLSNQSDFMYRGTMDAATQTPWNVAVSYQLDGKDVSADELAGATGALTMTLSLSPNSECTGPYADNYLLQVTGSFNTANTHDLTAESATTAQSGDNTQLSYMVFPGKSETYTITANVTDFSFDGWQIAGVPLSIALDVDDGQFGSATSELTTLSDAISQTNEGAGEVDDGAAALDEGMQELTSKNDALESGGSELDSAMGQLDRGAQDLSDTINNDLISGAEDLASGSTDYIDGLESSAQDHAATAAATDTSGAVAAYQQALESYTQAYSQAYGAAFASAYAQAVAADQDPQTAAEAAGQTAAATAVQSSQFASAKAAVQSALAQVAAAYATQQGNQSASDALESALENYQDIDDGIQSMVDRNSDSSVYTLAQGASDLSSGTAQTAQGASSLQEGIQAYSSGAESAAQGASALASGSQELSSGTQELADQTTNLDQKMIDAVRDQLEDFLNPDFTMMDFANGTTGQIDRVQFVYMTDSIKPASN